MCSEMHDRWSQLLCFSQNVRRMFPPKAEQELDGAAPAEKVDVLDQARSSELCMRYIDVSLQLWKFSVLHRADEFEDLERRRIVL